MKELLDQIMEIDHAANDRLNAAIRRKEEAKQQVDAEKEKISKEIEDYAKKHLEEFEATEQKNAQEAKDLIDQRLAGEKQRLRKIYNAKEEEWISELVSSVIGEAVV